MHLVLHVGAHKTGTSLIQKYYRDNRRLAVRLGISAISRTDTNRLIGWGDVTSKRPEVLRERLHAEAASRPVAVLVSHENSLGRPFHPARPGLYPRGAALGAALQRATDGFAPRVVLYVRPQPAFVESYYLQTVHQGAHHSFEEWFGALDADSLRWTPLVEALEDTFGADVAIGDFGEIAAGQEQFLRSFMRRARLPEPATVHYEPVRNASVSAKGLEVALAINPHLETRRERKAARRFLQSTFSNRTGERARPMPEDVRAHLESIWEDERASLEERARRSAALPAVAPPRLPPPRLAWGKVRQQVPTPRALLQRRRQ